MKTLNVWLDDILKAVAVLTLPAAMRNGARWTNRNAHRAWRYVCQTTLARYVRQVALAAVMLAVVWLTARQFRRAVAADGHAELAKYAVGAALMFMFLLFALGQRGEDDGPSTRPQSTRGV